MLARIGLAADPRPSRQGANRIGDLGPRRVEHGQRRPRPDEDAHVDPLGHVGQQRAEDDARLAALELEARARCATP